MDTRYSTSFETADVEAEGFFTSLLPERRGFLAVRRLRKQLPPQESQGRPRTIGCASLAV